ncbi:MAG: hypothetical protein Q4E61_04680 [Alphaproteobacteria bacterium]|nr:hypothetical protein [Alphaproteobacteria bacterium]
MKKIILTTILLINSVFASSDIVNPIESELKLYKTGIETLEKYITVNNGKYIIDESNFPSIRLSFVDNSDVLRTIAKYSKKVTGYLKDVLDDIDVYIGIKGEIDSPNDVLREAIRNAAFGNNRKMQENRSILMGSYKEFISQM